MTVTVPLDTRFGPKYHINHCARTGDGTARHALRRTDQRARPGIARRSLARHAPTRRRRHDHDCRHARNAIRARHGRSYSVFRWRSRGWIRTSRTNLWQSAARTDEGVCPACCEYLVVIPTTEQKVRLVLALA